MDQPPDDENTEPSYLADDISPEDVAAFFRAAAGLFRARPWDVVPSDDSLFFVTIEELGLQDAVLSVIGQMGESFGLVLFANIGDFQAYREAADDDDEPSLMPAHFEFNFDRGPDLPPALLAEIEAHGWEIAAPEAYPWLAAVDDDMQATSATANELAIAEAIALVLPRVLESARSELNAAWNGGGPARRSVAVKTLAGQVHVTLLALPTPPLPS